MPDCLNACLNAGTDALGYDASYPASMASQVPIEVQAASAKAFVWIGVGQEHNCGLDDAGVAWCWVSRPACWGAAKQAAPGSKCAVVHPKSRTE